MNYKKKIIKNLVNIPGWRTNRKIVVIESDDWGTITMPSKQVYNVLLKKGLPVDKNYFSKYDCLESEEDLSFLFEVLSSFKDFKGSHPCITACTIVANPLFEKIKESKYRDYHYEPFWETYQKYPGHEHTFKLWKNSLGSHLLWPQLHGREHFNPTEWLRILRTGDEWELLKFDHQAILNIVHNNSSIRHMGYLAAFDYETTEERNGFEQIIIDAQKLFKQAFGFFSMSFVAPTGIRSDKLDPILIKNQIRYHQGGGGQWLPKYEAENTIRNRYFGAINKYGQIYWRRNTTFEPSRDPDFNWIDSVMKEAEIAFRWHKPLVINSHRVNYIGGLSVKNRDRTLRLLKTLLKKITEKYPDIEFMSSDQLGDEILKNKKYFLGINLKGQFFDKKSRI